MINETDLFDAPACRPRRDKYHTWEAATEKCRVCGNYYAPIPDLWSDAAGVCSGCAHDAEEERFRQKVAAVQALIRSMRKAGAK